MAAWHFWSREVKCNCSVKSISSFLFGMFSLIARVVLRICGLRKNRKDFSSNVPFPPISLFFLCFFFYISCIFPLSPIVTRSEEWHLEHLVKNMSCIPKRHHAQPSAPSENTLSAQTVLGWCVGAAGGGSPGAHSLAGGPCCCCSLCAPSACPRGRGCFALCCPLLQGVGSPWQGWGFLSLCPVPCNSTESWLFWLFCLVGSLLLRIALTALALVQLSFQVSDRIFSQLLFSITVI